MGSSESQEFAMVWMWRVRKHPGWHAVKQAHDEQGRLHVSLLSPDLRATEADARRDGEASGLPEWTP